MSTDKDKHEVFRSKVCGCCMRKTAGMRTVTDSYLNLLKRFKFSDYSLDNPALPTSICLGCRRVLLDMEKVIFIL